MRRSSRLGRGSGALACAALLFAACSASTKQQPGSPDGGAPDGGVRPHPTPGPGQAAAWQITDARDLIGGPSTAGRVGDWVMANSRVRFVIEGARASDGYDPHGCSVVAADRQRPDGEPGQSRFGEMVLLFNFRGTGCDRMELVSDGTDDGVASLRATGQDEVLPYAASLFSAGTEPPPLHATLFRDYALAPDADVLQLTLTIRNDGSDALSLDAVYAAMAMNRGLRNWVPLTGFQSDNTSNVVNPSAEFYAAVGDKVSYSVLNLDSAYSPLISFSKILFGQYQRLQIAPGQNHATRFLIGVGTGDIGSLQAAHAQALGRQSRAVAVSGSVVGPSGEPIASARVHITDPGGTQAVSFARTAADGTWSAAIPAGSYAVRAVADDRAAPASQALSVGAGGLGGVKLSLAAAARIDVTATGDLGALPVKVVAEPVAFGRPNLPAPLGEKYSFEPIVAFTGSGHVTLPAFPGQWKVTVSRGFEYDVAVSAVVAPSGGVASVNARLNRVVDTTGWVSGDFHVHAQNSIDGDDLLAEKVRAFAAEGVEVPVATEHEYISDFSPTVTALGLGAFMHAIGGTELTTTAFGHFNVFPLLAQPAAVNAGAFAWYGRTIPEVIAEARTRRTPAGVPIVQMNHPRTVLMAYLDWVHFEPASFTAGVNAEHFMTGWDAMEVWNGGPLEAFEGCPTSDAACLLVVPKHPVAADWFGFLNKGLRVTGTGNSDSHTASLQPVGYPRTYLRVGSDDPAALDDAAVVTALKAQAAVISGGPFLLASATGSNGLPVGPGGTAAADWSSGAPIVKLKIDLQAPTWMGPLSRVDIWRGDANFDFGARLVTSIDLTKAPFKDTGTKVVRLSTTVAVSTPRDTWLVVTARGANSKALWPVVGGDVPPYAITNPIWVDADGDGKVTPLR